MFIFLNFKSFRNITTIYESILKLAYYRSYSKIVIMFREG